jgi:hypothetical protein
MLDTLRSKVFELGAHAVLASLRAELGDAHLSYDRRDCARAAR